MSPLLIGFLIGLASFPMLCLAVIALYVLVAGAAQGRRQFLRERAAKIRDVACGE